jgi:hypothetical protein
MARAQPGHIRFAIAVFLEAVHRISIRAAKACAQCFHVEDVMPDGEQRSATLDDILAELKEQGRRKKDIWDRLTPVSTFISSVILGVVGLWFTHSYNERQATIQEHESQQEQENKKHQARILEMQAVEKFMPYLTGEDEERKRVALLVITELASPGFATQFAKLNPSQGAQEATDRIMAAAVSPVQARPASDVSSKAAQAAPASPGSAVQSRTGGWVYVGHYVAQEGRWRTWYFDFPPDTDPASLPSSTLAVRPQTGSINVRVGMPTDSGEFPRVRQVLRPGSTVKVRSVREWSYTGYIWAEVDYET